jgi:hypothetical protein
LKPFYKRIYATVKQNVVPETCFNMKGIQLHKNETMPYNIWINIQYNLVPKSSKTINKV